ncbi:unnamed protein product [Gadus morhua 'NCC']
MDPQPPGLWGVSPVRPEEAERRRKQAFDARPAAPGPADKAVYSRSGCLEAGGVRCGNGVEPAAGCG